MKKIVLSIVALTAFLTLAGCGSQGPLTEEEQAAKYGYTLEEYRENKIAAARMNMTIDEHAKMLKEEAGMEGDMGM